MLEIPWAVSTCKDSKKKISNRTFSINLSKLHGTKTVGILTKRSESS